MQFRVRIQKKEGGEGSVLREAKDRFEAARKVRAEGYAVLGVDAVKESAATGVGEYFARIQGVPLREKIVFSHTLGAMLSAGLPLARALSVVERQSGHQRLREAIRSIAASIDAGEQLSAGLARYPDIFPRVMVAMVAAGEESGTLPTALATIASQLDKSYGLRKKIRGALMYPAIIVCAMLGIGAFMLVSVVPSIVASFTELGAELPASTKFVIALSGALSAYPLPSLLMAVGALLLFWWTLRTEWGRHGVHAAALRIPAVSTLVKQSNSGIMARTLSSLIASGVDMADALSITADVAPNSFYAASLLSAREKVEKGVTLSSVFREDALLYPALVPALTEVGEETGRLSEMLLNLAVFYEDEVDTATKNLSTIVEPVLMIGIGAAVGFFALSMIEPLYSITEHIQ